MDYIIPGLITLALIMILGFLGHYIFNKTQIPSIIWLLFFGVVLGAIFNVRSIIEPSYLMVITQFIASIAIVIILFDGGINTDLHQLFKGAPRGLLMSLTAFCLTLLATMGGIVVLSATVFPSIPFENSVLIGLILGAIVGGTSSPIVIPLVSRLENLEEKTQMVLSIESIITDPMCIVVVLAAIYMLNSAGGIDIALGIRNLIITFSIGGVMGLVSGLIWLPVMCKIQKDRFSYVVTLGVAFLVYAGTALIPELGGQGSGAIAVLVFGLVLGNGKQVMKMIDYSGRKSEMNTETKEMHALISFLIRTVFFVYLGLMVSFRTTQFIIIGILILILLILVRYLAVYLSTLKGGFETDDRQTMVIMMPRGLAAAILALSFGPELVNTLLPGLTDFFADISFVIILGTAIITTIGVFVISYSEKKKITLKKTAKKTDGKKQK